MKKESVPVRNSLLLLLTATIWGVAFVAQSVSMDYIGALPSMPFEISSVRSHCCLSSGDLVRPDLPVNRHLLTAKL